MSLKDVGLGTIMKAKLARENGITFSGESLGAEGERTGEVVFNTGITGYQEILTDPSYCGQIVTMTHPLIGNYGVNPDDMEGIQPYVAGFVVKEYFDSFSNFRGKERLGSWLEKQGLVAIQGIDTRMLTKTVRDVGAMRGIISTLDFDEKSLMEKILRSPKMAGLDLTRNVTCAKPYKWDSIDTIPFALQSEVKRFAGGGEPYTVVVYDFGVKRNILRRLTSHGCKLTVVPSDFSADETLSLNPRGVVLSNGPGDPAVVQYAIANIKKLLGKKPIFGICLGHQLFALAMGGKTFKLKFGHRGANHPVRNLLTNEIEITSQNHGFAVDPDSLDQSQIEITHTNLNDGTNEGLRHRRLPVFSVQYHSEASPGPHDSDYLFRDFIRIMKSSFPTSLQGRDTKRRVPR